MRGKYRSAVYVFDPSDATHITTHLATLQSGFDDPLVTRVLTARGFKPSDHRFHNYYATDPDRPFCKTYIDPKLALLRQNYARHLENG